VRQWHVAPLALRNFVLGRGACLARFDLRIAYLFVLLPFVLIALELAFEVADKLDGR